MRKFFVSLILVSLFALPAEAADCKNGQCRKAPVRAKAKKVWHRFWR